MPLPDLAGDGLLLEWSEDSVLGTDGYPHTQPFWYRFKHALSTSIYLETQDREPGTRDPDSGRTCQA